VGLLARDLVGAPAENIAERLNASGAVRPDQIMGQWKSSPGHRANLLAPGFTHVGYGVAAPGPRGDRRRRLCRGLRPPGRARPAAGGVGRRHRRGPVDATPRIDQFSVSEPGAEALSRPMSKAPAPRPCRRRLATAPAPVDRACGPYQVAWGPVFVLG
jgi:hypothetical protein